ncbi:MAG: hypothetical protein ABWJ99_07065 [Caldimicrobium sp.]
MLAGKKRIQNGYPERKLRRGVGSDLEVIIIVSRPEEPFIRVYTERELAKLKDTNFIKRL